MIHNIADNIQSLAVDIELLRPLENNARRGNVDAIMASYNKFGQVKPIVAIADDNGALTVIAGNHQLEAAKRLGWQQIAVSVVDLDNDDALAFALADNRISDLGTTDNEMLYELLTDVIGDDENFFEVLGWDDFSVAAIENTVITAEFANDSNAGWTAPEIVLNDVGVGSPPPAVPTQTESPATQPVQTPTPDTSTIVTQGSTSTGSSGVSNASIQFTLVFDSAEQQSKWYAFIKWLRESPVYDGDTTSERLFDFIAQHSEMG
jgi:hypothetical protein